MEIEMIGITIVTLLLVGQSYGNCEDDQTNYTSIQYKIVYKEFYTKKYETTKTKSCTLWIFRCKVKLRTKVTTVKTVKPTAESYSVLKCCPGFTNDSNVCTEGCEKGKYGVNCTEHCNWCPSYCERVSGYCLCTPGKMGDNCTEECPDDRYGANCTHTCRCSNNSTCNGIDGSCNCTSPGWHGTLCDNECANNTYGLYCNGTCSCNENETCDHVNGSCICKSGWHGENCSEECDAMKFGVDCLQNCSCDHKNTDTCDRETGLCYCNPGYTGIHCTNECEMGTFGENCSKNCSDKCVYTEYCDHKNGSCLCPGMRGPNCSLDCEMGTFGPNCDFPCNCSDNSINNKTCDHLNGTCSCKPGWTGRICDQESDSNTSDAMFMSDSPAGFIEQNLLYLVIGFAVLFILIVVTVTAVCIRSQNLCQSLFRRQGKRTSLIANSHENQEYSSSVKEAIPITNLSTKSEQNTYEDAVVDENADIDANHDAEIVSNGDFVDKLPEDRTSVFKRTDMVQKQVEGEYSVPDQDDHIYDVEQLNDSKTSNNAEELYNCTQDEVVVSKDAPNEYNTFKDVLKIQQEERKMKEVEEDYDVISHAGHTDSKKSKAKELEHYSSFEQVRKLSLQNSCDEEEDTYNELNEHLHEHKSAHINANQYHHVSMKNKTVDGEKFDKTKTFSRISSKKQSNTSSNTLTKQSSLLEKDVITEEVDEDLANKEDKDKTGDILEEDSEVIYDECVIDDFEKELTSEKNEIHQEVPDASVRETVYEDVDENDDETTSAVVYEDVDSESHKSESSEEEEKVEDKEAEHVSDQGKPLIKRSKERRREDYEEFAL